MLGEVKYPTASSVCHTKEDLCTLINTFSQACEYFLRIIIIQNMNDRCLDIIAAPSINIKKILVSNNNLTENTNVCQTRVISTGSSCLLYCREAWRAYTRQYNTRNSFHIPYSSIQIALLKTRAFQQCVYLNHL